MAMLGNLIAGLFGPRRATTTGPKDFPSFRSGWEGRGVSADFDGLHGLQILVSDQTAEYNEETYNRKRWFTNADEVLFRRGKRIMLYWRSA